MVSLKFVQTGIFLLIWIVYASTYLIRKPLGVIKHHMASELKFSRLQLGWLDAALLLPYSLVQVFCGPYSDRVGPRKTLGVCLFATGLSLITFSSWDNFWVITLLFFISGASQAPCWPACCKILAAWFADDAQNTAFGAMSTSAFGGSIIATALAVYLVDLSGWRLVFVIPSFIVLVLAVIAWFCMRMPAELNITVPGKAKVHSKRQHLEQSLWQLWRLPSVAELAFAMMCLKLVRYSMYLWLPIYLSQALGYSNAQAGLFSLLFDVGAVTGGAGLGILVDRHWSKQPLLPVLLSGLVGTAAFLLFILTATWGFGYNAVFIIIAGAGVCAPDALIGGSVAVSIGEAEGRSAGAAVTGLINGFGSLGAVIEGPLIGVLSDLFGWDSMFVLMIVLSTLGSACVGRAISVQKNAARSIPLLSDEQA